MSAFIRKISKIGIILTLMMFCVGIVGAASYDEYRYETISVEFIKNNPNRFVTVPTISEDRVSYIDLAKIELLRDDELFRVIKTRFVSIDYGEYPRIVISDEIFKYNMNKPQTVDNKVLDFAFYTFNGRFDFSTEGTINDKLRKFKQCKREGLAYMYSDIIYYTVFGEDYDPTYYDEVIKPLEQQ